MRKKIEWCTIKTIECLCVGTIGLIVAPWKFDVLKTSIFAIEASLLGQIFVLRTSNFRGRLSADSSSTETLYCLRQYSAYNIRKIVCHTRLKGLNNFSVVSTRDLAPNFIKFKTRTQDLTFDSCLCTAMW